MTKEYTVKNMCINDTELKGGIILVKKKAAQLWERPLIRHYTEHGIRHSINVIKIIDKLIGSNLVLNDYESFILQAAVYLHDIGMQQSNSGVFEDNQIQRSLEQMDVIRKMHNDLSSDMILDSIKDNSICPSLALENFHDYVDNIACLVKYHRKYDLNDLEDDSYKGEKIRIPLLAALLRLGDELDADCDRVNIEQLKYDNIPTESKFYWWCCYYVKSINIENGKICITFRFPLEYKNSELILLVRNQVKNSFITQFDQVYDLLDRYNLRLYKDIPCNEQYTGVIEKMPNDLLAYLKKKTIKK